MKNKRFFEEAELTVVRFGDTDIITTSEKHDILQLVKTIMDDVDVD